MRVKKKLKCCFFKSKIVEEIKLYKEMVLIIRGYYQRGSKILNRIQPKNIF